jgi:dihydropteroate synthase
MTSEKFEHRKEIQEKLEQKVTWGLVDRTAFYADKKYIMGILNCTPDSFSDGGVYKTTQELIDQGNKLIDDGADILDIGGESTRPGFTPVPWYEELGRVHDVVQYFANRIPISIDTYSPKVAEIAAYAGAEILNSVYGLKNIGLRGAIGKCNMIGIHTHNVTQYPNPSQIYAHDGGVIKSVIKSLQEDLNLFRKPDEYRGNTMLRVTDEGLVDLEKIETLFIDPGFGFGKTPEENNELLQNIDVIKDALKKPILVGTSRKNFYDGNRKLTTEETIRIAVEKGATIFRVHDAHQAAKILEEYR